MTKKRWIVGGGLATLALASTLAAGSVFAQSGTPDPQTRAQTFIDRLAQNLGLSSDQVKQGLQKTQEQYVDDAVASGKITAEQGDAMKQKIESGDMPFAFGPGFMGGPGHEHRGGVEFHGNGLATALGMTPQELFDALRSGKTLQQIITDQGKTVDDVVNTLVAQAKSEFDRAVANGRLTQDQANQHLSDLKQKLTDAINNNSFGPGKLDGIRGKFHGGPGLRGFPHQMPSQTPAQSS